MRFGGDYQWLKLHSTKSEKRFVTGSVYVKFELKKRKATLKKNETTSELSDETLATMWEDYLNKVDPFHDEDDAAGDITQTDEQGFYESDAQDEVIEQILDHVEIEDDEDEERRPVNKRTDELVADDAASVASGGSETDVSEMSFTDENSRESPYTMLSQSTVDLKPPPLQSTQIYLRDSCASSATDLDSTDNPATNSSSKSRRKFGIKRKVKRDNYSFSADRDVLGVVFLEIISAEGLPPFKGTTRKGFDMDPFVVVSFGRKVYRSSWRKHTLSPVFNERLAFEVLPFEKKYEIQFNVLDKDHFSFNDQVAMTDFPVSKLMEDSELDQHTADEDAGIYASDGETDVAAKKKKKLIGRNPDKNLNKSPSAPSKLRTYNLKLNMNHSVSKLIKPDQEYNPTLKIRAHFEHYTTLRKAFWISLLSKYDEDKSGHLDILQLEHFIKSIGSTLTDRRLESIFQKYSKNPWAGETLTLDQIADSFEELTHDKDTEDSSEHFFEVPVCPICKKKRLSNKSDSDIITHVAVCASRDWSTVNKMLQPSFASGQMAAKRWYSKVFIKLTYGKYGVGRNSANILVQDRKTGLIMEEKMSVYVRLGIKLFYKSFFDRAIDKRKMKTLLRNLSVKQGIKFDSPASASQIASFVQFHQLDLAECLVQDIKSYGTFNEFFYRKLKPGARPLESQNPLVLSSPCDCRCTVFESVAAAKQLWIKGKDFTIQKLLYKNDQGYALSEEDLAKYQEGAVAVFRLAPQDYHRFHSPCEGVIGKPIFIDGEYYTVNPMAIRSELDVFGDNVRCILPIETKEFGTVMMIPVGAMMVGSILLTVEEGECVSPGDEIGYFKFGGSTILLLFEKGAMQFDSDLIQNSNEQVETLIKVGMSIGHSPEVEELERQYHDWEKQPEADQLRIIRSITGGAGIKGPSLDMIDNNLIAKINQQQPSDEISLKELSWEAYNMDIDEEDKHLLTGLDLDDVSEEEK